MEEGSNLWFHSSRQTHVLPGCKYIFWNSPNINFVQIMKQGKITNVSSYGDTFNIKGVSNAVHLDKLRSVKREPGLDISGRFFIWKVSNL